VKGWWQWFLCAAALLLIVATGSAGASTPSTPLETAIFDPFTADGGTFAEARAAGAAKVRIVVDWRAAAPADDPGASFRPADPADSHYNWTSADKQVEAAVRAGLDPIVDIATGSVPTWARLPAPAGYSGTANLPDPRALAAFAHAAAVRYGGRFEHLPRVRYWQVWNEPNLATFLKPQLVGGRPVAPDVYAQMVNAFAAAVKSVHTDNFVIAGGLAPFEDNTPETYAQAKDWGPLTFTRDVLCLSPTLQPTCKRKVRFDAWSIHPYTSGGPTHHALLADDVSLGDLGKMRAVLDAATKAHHIVSRAPVAFWVTEFSWDSDPPDPGGVPTNLLERWVPQALYQMWRNGVSLVTWFLLEDQPLSSSPYQSGLFEGNGDPKPYMEGFRFPLVAFPRGGQVYVWGRTPFGKRGRVLVEQEIQGAWKRLGIVPTDGNGIFEHTFSAHTVGWIRGRLIGSGERTLPFSLKAVPDHSYKPFG
jgi:hypothetical protein